MASRMFEPARALEVIAPKYGSAYRIGGRLVLTCAHLVAEVGSGCQVRSKPNFTDLEAKVVWKAKQADVALLELPATIEPCEAVVFGELPLGKTGEKLEFQLYGWPQWGRTNREGDRTAAGGRQIEGIIYLADTSPDGLLVLEPQRLPAGRSLDGSEWEGTSGAAVLCHGLVVAVQRQHQNPDRPASLEAELLSQIYGDEQWGILLKAHNINPQPESLGSGTQPALEVVKPRKLTRAKQLELEYRKTALIDCERDYKAVTEQLRVEGDAPRQNQLREQLKLLGRDMEALEQQIRDLEDGDES